MNDEAPPPDPMLALDRLLATLRRHDVKEYDGPAHAPRVVFFPAPVVALPEPAPERKPPQKPRKDGLTPEMQVELYGAEVPDDG